MGHRQGGGHGWELGRGEHRVPGGKARAQGSGPGMPASAPPKRSGPCMGNSKWQAQSMQPPRRSRLRLSFTGWLHPTGLPGTQSGCPTWPPLSWIDLQMSSTPSSYTPWVEG